MRTHRHDWINMMSWALELGVRYEDRYVFIVDRKKDRIISGGKNIYPREIEEVIYTHEAVLEAAVIGVPDDYWQEKERRV